MELAVRINARYGALVASTVGDRSGAPVGVRDGAWVDAAVQVGETRKGSPVEAGASGAANWQAARPSMKQAARPHIHFAKRYPTPI